MKASDLTDRRVQRIVKQGQDPADYNRGGDFSGIVQTPGQALTDAEEWLTQNIPKLFAGEADTSAPGLKDALQMYQEQKGGELTPDEIKQVVSVFGPKDKVNPFKQTALDSVKKINQILANLEKKTTPKQTEEGKTPWNTVKKYLTENPEESVATGTGAALGAGIGGITGGTTGGIIGTGLGAGAGFLGQKAYENYQDKQASENNVTKASDFTNRRVQRIVKQGQEDTSTRKQLPGVIADNIQDVAGNTAQAVQSAGQAVGKGVSQAGQQLGGMLPDDPEKMMDQIIEGARQNPELAAATLGISVGAVPGLLADENKAAKAFGGAALMGAMGAGGANVANNSGMFSGNSQAADAGEMS